MFDRGDLRAAVGANVLSADQASRLEACLLSRKDDGAGNEQIGQENLRFLANFNDVFITLGLVILFIGVSTMVGMIASPALAQGNILAGVISALVVGGLAWVLLEYFCGRRRLLLPSMALTLIFSPVLMTQTLKYFSSGSAPIYFPGAAFLLASIITLIALIPFAVGVGVNRRAIEKAEATMPSAE